MTAMILLIALPIVAALLVGAVRKNAKLLATLPLVVAGVSILGFLLALGASPLKLAGAFVGPFTLHFELDAWRLLLLAFVCTFELMTGIYALKAVARAARPALLVASLLLAFGSAAGVVLTSNVLVLLVFWEMFLLALYGAIASGGEQAERTAFKALIIGGASDFLMILGLMTYLVLRGSIIMGGGAPIDIATTPRAGLVAFVLIFLGAGAKAGMFPFHTWIPQAAEVMPATGFAALPASLEKILGISFLYTLTSKMFVLDGRARAIMMVFAVITTFVVILPALVEPNLKRVLALTAISPVGFMIAGMATSAMAGMAGALMYMLTHATYKSSMFFAAGTLEKQAGSDKLADLRGLGRAMPVLGWGFALAFLGAVSLPPTGGFMAKELIFEGLLHHHNSVVLALLVVAAVLNIAVFSKVLAVLWERRPEVAVHRAPGSEVLPAFLLGLAAALTGLFFTLATPAFEATLGPAEHGMLTAMWTHVGPLTGLSLLIYILGFGVYLTAREHATSAAETFGGLVESPVTGPGLRMAAAGKLDAYEIGLKVVDWLTRVVFRYFERLIDVVVDGIIAGGKAVFRPALSAIHNGVYSNYLAWAVVGLIAVLALVLM